MRCHKLLWYSAFCPGSAGTHAVRDSPKPSPRTGKGDRLRWMRSPRSGLWIQLSSFPSRRKTPRGLCPRGAVLWIPLCRVRWAEEFSPCPIRFIPLGASLFLDSIQYDDIKLSGKTVVFLYGYDDLLFCTIASSFQNEVAFS